jgi:hypothetical protein
MANMTFEFESSCYVAEVSWKLWRVPKVVGVMYTILSRIVQD